MTEKEMAAYFQEHRDDPTIWETKSTPVESKKEPAVVFSVRFLPSELEGIRKQADAMGVTVANIIRNAVLEYSSNQMVVFNFQGLQPGITLLGNIMIPSHIAHHCDLNSHWRFVARNDLFTVGRLGAFVDDFSRAMMPPPAFADSSSDECEGPRTIFPI
ncbi:MAG TPA: hypothetical protein VNU74_08795 [Terriglobales bacterium]|jgi:hypothetical protein|nr:hypothetical protein [Terriglobales bacterium]